MSKKSGAAKKRRKQAKARKRNDKTPAGLLASLAAALNDCEQAGIRIQHQYLLTGHGALIAFKHGWVVRPFGGDGPVPARLDD